MEGELGEARQLCEKFEQLLAEAEAARAADAKAAAAAAEADRAAAAAAIEEGRQQVVAGERRADAGR